MDLDTEDRVDRVKLSMRAVAALVSGSDPLCRIDPHPLAMLLDLINEEFERALPVGGGRPPRAVNDEDGPP